MIISVLAAALVFTACADSNNDNAEETTIGETASEASAETVISEQETDEPAETTAETVTSEAALILSENGFSSSEMEEQYTEKSDSLKSLYEQISSEKDHPAINITTLDGEKILSKDEYVTSVIDVFNCDESYTLSAEAGVKVRGNSTAEQEDEKPYRIKFTQKHNMLGLHDGNEYKSWVLLRSYWNLCPDYMAFSLADAIFDGKYYSSDCTYANLYINGEYAGLYLLAEQNQAAKGRVDIHEPTNDETSYKTGYFIELDNYAGDDDHPYFTISHGDSEFTDINGEARKFEDKDYTLKSDIISDEQLSFIEKYTDGAFEILWQAVQNNKAMMFDDKYNVIPADGTYSTPEEAVSAVMDLESLSDMLILEELVQNYDVGAGSFFMAVDLSAESKYPKLTFLAPWDFNWAYYEDPNSNYYAGAFQKVMDEDRSNPWLTTAMKADWFQKIVKSKWTELSADDSLHKVTEQVSEDISLLENDLGENAWSIYSGMSVVDFVNSRIEWLNSQWSE